MAPGAEVAPHLARHGVKPEVVDLVLNGPASETMLDHAELTKADLIVMGAFAHPGWRQLVLGGLTEAMLRDATLPLFMSH
jgi:nucleotide-binding universal stress UspA family protein